MLFKFIVWAFLIFAKKVRVLLIFRAHLNMFNGIISVNSPLPREKVVSE